MTRKVSKIILHCSASDSPYLDKISEIRRIHVQENHWKDVGYHYFIRKNGALEKGRDESVVGSHCKNENHDSIGVCLSGNAHFNTIQFIEAAKLVLDIQRRYNISDENVYPHCHFNKNKTCPNFPLEDVFYFKRSMK